MTGSYRPAEYQCTQVAINSVEWSSAQLPPKRTKNACMLRTREVTHLKHSETGLHDWLLIPVVIVSACASNQATVIAVDADASSVNERATHEARGVSGKIRCRKKYPKSGAICRARLCDMHAYRSAAGAVHGTLISRRSPLCACQAAATCFRVFVPHVILRAKESGEQRNTTANPPQPAGRKSLRKM